MPFVRPDTPEPVTLHPPETIPTITAGDWFKIAPSYDVTMQRKIARRTEAILGEDGGNAGRDHAYIAFKQALLETVIVAWSDDAPITPANIATLHPELVEWLATEFNDRQRGRSDAEKNDFTPPPSEPTDTAESYPPN